MTKIKNIIGRQVFDSRGFPTVEAEVVLENGIRSKAIVPSGASTGSYEAVELRDIDNKYLKKGVSSAVKNINTELQRLIGSNVNDQNKIDNQMIDIDGTKNKSNIGANSILAVSIASCKAGALNNKLNLFEHIDKKNNDYCLPYPMLNIINGGAHANNTLKIQEFMIRPDGAKNFTECLQISFLIIQRLKELLIKKNLSSSVGDEGGFAPSLDTDDSAIELILSAIHNAGFKAGEDVIICLDVASNELYEKNKYKILDDKLLSSDEMIDFYYNITKKYPILSIEDPIFEDDWDTWSKLNKKLGSKIQIVGDDLFVTNINRLKKGVEKKSANAILIKLNQIGTLTETLETINYAKKNNFKTIISHRSGDTEDTFIADLCVATNSSQIKTGSLARSERVSKYNRLIRIEEILNNKKMGRL
ncbi:MAG: phosphopyruvate hydratase [Candidatus Pelagibacter sp.]|nr:phosphopyruvate hydratase [Candidatus Pelagibacter sp.]OUW11659.1 MAG: phosphopyruvate hydratase [Candidatus Pelagibacter sp. TMED166]|tara:strand:- start:21803 stop:23056 length:1254 start_codon:yes stop_codon:yes gene_type:complete